MNLNTLAVTFSHGHIDSQIALDVRFLGGLINYLIEEPTRLELDIPLNWQRQRDTLYLANFFQKDKIRELFLAQEQDDPNTAYIKFNLYRSAAEHKEGTKALEYIADAVTLDPMYALEYFELSNMAYNKGQPDEALRMLKLADEVFHEDPFLKLQMAQLANEIGQKEVALEMLNKVRNLSWSEPYYPDMKQYIADLTIFIQSGEMPSQPDNINIGQEDQTLELIIPEEDSSRQKIMHNK
jgi:tetratricopeptide (TPR) repeat protein